MCFYFFINLQLVVIWAASITAETFVERGLLAVKTLLKEHIPGMY